MYGGRRLFLMGSVAVSSFSDRLLAWYDSEGRRGLPWHLDKTPYRIWVSEIMLQQTQVRTVVPYFERFVEKFPTPSALASASLDEVLRLWAGLGYYARARNLHRAARQVCERFGGEVPCRYELLVKLPGIGRSTAGAILALCFGQTFPILDGNAKRVLARYGNIEGWPGTAAVSRQLWALSGKLLPAKRVADYTQALMDLGSTLCTRARPRCCDCPVSSGCQARASGCVADRPAPAPRRHRPRRSVGMLILTHGDKVLLQRRPPGGIWGGLLCLPEVEQAGDAAAWCQRHFGVSAEARQWEKFVHQFTHFSLDICPVGIHLPKTPRQVMESDGLVWYKIHDAGNTGVPAPIRKLLAKLASTQITE